MKYKAIPAFYANGVLFCGSREDLFGKIVTSTPVARNDDIAHPTISRYKEGRPVQMRMCAGHFQREDWTAISDVGKIYNEKVLTEAAYIAVEQAYLSRATRFKPRSKTDRTRR